MDEEKIFKALADASRRKLLDVLFEQDGQTLTQLEAHLDMTRFGVMKHLDLLEEAGLITTQKVGREKHHFLNPVPIERVYERWVSKFARSWTRTLSGLKTLLEDKETMEAQTHVFRIMIRTTPDKLWQAITDGTMTQLYYFGSRVESEWQTGAPYQYTAPNGDVLLKGEVLEIDPPRRLVQSFYPLYAGAEAGAERSMVTWEIEQHDAICKLTLTHAELTANAAVVGGMIDGWTQIVSSIKTLLETGKPLA